MFKKSLFGILCGAFACKHTFLQGGIAFALLQVTVVHKNVFLLSGYAHSFTIKALFTNGAPTSKVFCFFMISIERTSFPANIKETKKTLSVYKVFVLGANRVNFKPKRKTVAENFLSLKVCLKKLKFT